MDKPQVDSIEGIPPAIAIEQRNTVRTTRSTVGTMTEICDYLKLLWPHIAQLHCRQCGRPVRKESPQQIWETVQDGMENGEWGSHRDARGDDSEFRTAPSELLITFELPLSEKLALGESLALIAKQGYQRLLVEAQTASAIATAGFSLRESTGSLTVQSKPGARTAATDFAVARIEEARPWLLEQKPASLTVV